MHPRRMLLSGGVFCGTKRASTCAVQPQNANCESASDFKRFGGGDRGIDCRPLAADARDVPPHCASNAGPSQAALFRV